MAGDFFCYNGKFKIFRSDRLEQTGSDAGLFSPQIRPKIFLKLVWFNLTENQKSPILRAFH
nr:MAG TPA: hypothetical protein [Caudoviricetes sp.]